MARIISFPFPLPNGLHARPASSLEEAVRPFRSTVTFANARSARRASARSVLGLVSTGTRQGDPCELVIEGEDEDAAQGVLSAFLERVFPQCDEPLAPPAEAPDLAALPRSLVAAGLSGHHRGQIACGGLGWGRLRLGTSRAPAAARPSRTPAAPAQELADFRRAVQSVAADLEGEMKTAGGVAASVLQAHLAMLRDPGLSEGIAAGISSGTGAAEAVAGEIAALAGTLRSAESAYLRERVLDLEDLGARLLEKLGGAGAVAPVPVLREPTIFAASALTPGRFLALDRRYLQGLVLGPVGMTSHTVILARSFGIPTLAGLAAALPLLRPDMEAILDGRLGLLIPEPAEGVARFYERERAKLAQLQARSPAQATGATRDGRRLEIAANISTAEEAASVFAQGADGIGLFRTEMLFMGRTAAPSEDEQYEAYAACVRASRGRTLIVRTLDIGGDKPVPYLDLPKENNPFLGCRGVRCYADRPELIKTQFRALARAAAHGPLKIMIPMVAQVEEVRLCRRLLAESLEELRAGGAAFADQLPLGIMLEVPSAAFAMDELCAEADFFSIGTNDLAQYFFAADRENPRVSDPRCCFHPAFLRLLKQFADSARAHRRWIGLCGEFGESPAALPLLVALGFDEISLAAPRIAAVKSALARLESASCEALLEGALRCATTGEVFQRLADRSPRPSPVPLLPPELVILDSASATKEEAIREMADALQLAGRTDFPERIEAAVWQREDAYTTGFGEGFAIPHCQTDDVSANSMVLVRFRQPVAWKSLDDRPVDTAVLLAIRAQDRAKEHLAALGRFSRLLLNEEFQAQIRGERDPSRLAALIAGRLNQ